ncbi:MAG: ABC transporter ATP-binding protein/permease [Defluviitaleaceae bacterium]|nr:ABC transporter ATP-binding protein/permease [Defluviitaleaceae bacterium]
MKSIKILISNMKFLFEFAWKVDKGYFLALFFLIISYVLFNYFLVTIPYSVLEMIENNNENYLIILKPIIYLFITGMLVSLCRIKIAPIGNKIRYALMLEGFAQNINLSYDYYDKKESKDKMWLNLTSVMSFEGVESFYSKWAYLLGEISTICLFAFILFQLNSVIILFLLFFTLMISIVEVKVSNYAFSVEQENSGNKRQMRYMHTISSDFAYAKEIRIFKLKMFLTQKIDAIIFRLKENKRKAASKQAKYSLINITYQLIRDGAIYIFLFYGLYNNTLTIAEFSVYIILIIRLNESTQLFIDYVKAVLGPQKSINDLINYISLKEKKQEGDKLKKLPYKWEIEFKDVCFKYENSNQFIYKDLNFSIKSGEKIAIVGLNGAGKTTLIKLLLRLHEPTSGEILFNDKNINEYELDNYFKLFAPVFQEVNIFATSLKDNIGFEMKFNEDEMYHSIKVADFVEKFQDFENGFDSEMTKYLDVEGIALSGGESQKVSLARAAYHNRPILILDEPSSALDAISEYNFYSHINTTFIDKTILFISHRLASTDFCDKIILVGDGTIKEKGTHLQLMEQKKEYFRLFETQAKYYRDGGVKDEK